MPGKEDFTTPTDMIAQSLGNIDMNLDSQTLANADISINKTPAESVEFIDVTQSGSVSAGGSESVTVSPPSGYLYELIGMKISIPSPSGASSGDHQIFLRSETEFIIALSGKSTYSTQIIFDRNHFTTADSNTRPANAQAQMLSFKNLRADSLNGFQVLYQNDTDGSHSSDRTYKFWVRKIKVS